MITTMTTQEEREKLIDEIWEIFNNDAGLSEDEVLAKLDEYPDDLVKSVTDGILVVLTPRT